MKGKKILVSGASGFVGFSLALELASSNEVHGIARFRDASMRRILEDAGVTIIVKDVTGDGLDNVPTDFDYVFNELAMLRICDDYPREAFLVNTRFVADLLEHCRAADGVILASTGAVYKPSAEAWNENGRLLPANTYAVSKLCGEILGGYVSEKLNVPTCILRYFYPYGPLGVGGILARWADMMRRGEAIPVNRATVPYYNPHFISDCVELTIKAAELCKVPAATINVAGTEIKSKIQLLDMIREAFSVDYSVKDSRADFAWVGDVSVMVKSLGEPKINLRNGIAIMVKQRYNLE